MSEFEQWLQQLDRYVERFTGLSSSDFEDWGFADAFDSGATPAQAARDFLEEVVGL